MGKPVLQSLGVLVAELEINPCVAVGKNRSENSAFAQRELIEFLMGQNQAETIFPCSGENCGDGWRHEVVSFIQIEEKRSPLRLRNSLARESRLIISGD